MRERTRKVSVTEDADPPANTPLLSVAICPGITFHVVVARRTSEQPETVSYAPPMPPLEDRTKTRGPSP